MTAPSTVAAAMQHAIDMLRELTPAQLEDLAIGRARLVFRTDDDPPVAVAVAVAVPATQPVRAAARSAPAGPQVTAEVTAEVTTAVEAIRRLTTPAEVAAYLDEHDRRFTTPMLKKIAKALGPTVTAGVRSKADLKRNIVEGTAGFRTRSAAMSGGAW